MKLLIIGATGQVGQRLTQEALSRHHRVTAASRSGKVPAMSAGRVNAVALDSQDSASLSELFGEHDAVINATRSATNDVEQVIAIAEALLNASSESQTPLLFIGGAASLKIPDVPGRLLIDDPRYLPEEWRAVGETSLAQFQWVQRSANHYWSYLCPPANLAPGKRTGDFRVGQDTLLVNSRGEAHISMEDLAVAALDELEQPRNRQRPFTVAYA